MGYKDLVFPKESVFLVTGSAGFIGSNLVEAILDLGYKVRGVDNFSTGTKENMQSFFNNPNFEFVEGDICNFDTCMEVCQNINYILHQAAWGSVPRSIEMPLFYEKVNINGTLNMMEAAKQSKVEKFVYASSSSVYGDEPNLPKTEGIEGNVLSPYALTKKVNEEYGKLYTELYGLETYGLRYFNVFGKRQNPDGSYAAIIPKFIKQLLNNQPPTINGDGNQSRDFTYIENVIEANLKSCAAKKDSAGQSYNIAYGGRETILDIFGYLCKQLDKNITPIFGPNRIGDIKHSNANIDKAKINLGYNPEWNFEMGLEKTLDWYKENYSNDDL